MMSNQDVDEKTTENAPEAPEAAVRTEAPLAETGPRTDTVESAMPTQLGATRHVLAGFFAPDMPVTYVVANAVDGVWHRLADNPWLSHHAPFLSRIGEDDRPTFAALFAGVVGISVTVYAYRRPDIRTWTNEVAAELAKVTWPNKKEVTNSTMVVIAASAFATVFLALLDRFWGFVTNLVYGS